jgi:hypothetical protein
LLAWVVVAVIAATFVESALDLDRQWMAFVVGVGAIVLLPPAAYGEWRVMVLWELLVVVAVPLIGRALYPGAVGAFASYFAVAGSALIVTVELHTFTELEVTHWFAVALVAGTGYIAARAIDLHEDDIHIPRRFAFVYILVVVLSFGVGWELFEFGLDVASAETGLEMPLARHGLDDTVRDLMFDSLGALLVAAFGQAHLTNVADRVRTGLIARG